MISFKNVPHFIAKFVKAVAKDGPAFIAKLEGSKPLVEGVSAVAAGPQAPLVVGLEDLGYALIGEIGNVILSGNAAAAQHLTDAGLDINVVNSVKAALAGFQGLPTVVKSLVPVPVGAPSSPVLTGQLQSVQVAR